LRVAFVTFSTVPFGPNDLLFYRTAEELLRHGHQVLISPFDWGPENAEKYDISARQGAIVWRRARNRRSQLFFVRQWQKVKHRIVDHRKSWRFIDRFAPDIVVVNDPGTFHMISAPGFVDYLMNSQIQYATISQYNDENTSLPAGSYQRARMLFDKAKHCIFVAQRNLDVAQRQLCLALEHGVVFDNPPNLVSWEPVPFPRGKFVRMAMVARLECAVKGQALVLQALTRPQWRDRCWELNIYGRGPDESYLRDLIAFVRLQDRVRLRGHVDDVRTIWAENQLLVMASSGEGKPLALTEAMLCGRPAVVTDVGGNAELITEAVTGFVAESATLASLGKALERAWQQKEHWDVMGCRAHRIMMKRLQPPPEELLARLLMQGKKPSACRGREEQPRAATE
jgi:glycosyltransferase involved in cell wall biosynthesis